MVGPGAMVCTPSLLPRSITGYGQIPSDMVASFWGGTLKAGVGFGEDRSYIPLVWIHFTTDMTHPPLWTASWLIQAAACAAPVPFADFAIPC